MRTTTTRVMGLGTRVLVAGEAGGGEPVLLIHGIGGWAENWRGVMGPIAATGRPTYAIDLPGFGESEGPGRVSHFGPRDPFYSSFIVELLDRLALGAVHLVGNSLGGAVAYMTAVSSPARIRSLTLAAPGGLGTDVPWTFRLATVPGMIVLARWFGRPEHSRASLRSCFYDPSRIPDELYREVERYGLATYPEFVRALRSSITLGGVRPRLRRTWIERASAYRGPVLLLWGREDAVLPLGHLAAAREILPRAEVHVIERCGHLIPAERPAEFLEVFLPFVDGAERAVAA